MLKMFFSIVNNKKSPTRLKGINTQEKVCIFISFSPLSLRNIREMLCPDSFWHLLRYNALYCREDAFLYRCVESIYFIRPVWYHIMYKCRPVYESYIRERRGVIHSLPFLIHGQLCLLG